MDVAIDQLFTISDLASKKCHFGFLPVGGKDRVLRFPRQCINQFAMPVKIPFIAMRADVGGVKLLQIQFQWVFRLSGIQTPSAEGLHRNRLCIFWSNKLMQHSPAASVGRLLYDSHNRRLASRAGTFRWQPRGRSEAA